MSNSPLVVFTRLSPNYTKMTNKKNNKITIHYMACDASIEVCGAGFADKSRRASSNYGIDSNGRVGLYVDESNRSWCSNSVDNDGQAVTIEVACKRGGDWPITDKAMSSLIDLCVDICKRNGIPKLNYTGDASGNLTMHCFFAHTPCPGPYLKSKYPYIAAEVNKRLGETDSVTVPEEEKEPEQEVVSSTLKVGDKVKLVSGAKYTNGSSVASFLFSKTLYVRVINGDSITISIYKTGAITGVVDKKYLTTLDGVKPEIDNKPIDNKESSDFKVGDEVKLISGAKYYDGKSMPSWLFGMKLYVRKLYGDNIVISTLKTGAVTGTVSKKYLVKY